MKVQIEGNIYLESDGTQFVLKEYYTVKEGKNAGEESSNLIGYFTNVQQALMRFLRMKIMDSTATNLLQLIEDIRRIEVFIRTTFEVELSEGERKAV